MATAPLLISYESPQSEDKSGNVIPRLSPDIQPVHEHLKLRRFLNVECDNDDNIRLPPEVKT